MTDLPTCLLLIVTGRGRCLGRGRLEPLVRRRASADALACPGVLPAADTVSSGEISESDRGQGKRTRTRYTTVYELDSPAAVETGEFKALRGWGRFFAPYPLTNAGRVPAAG